MSVNLSDLPQRYHDQAATQLRDHPKRVPLPDMEQCSRIEPEKQDENQERPKGCIRRRCFIRVISHRTQLADPDGICAKWLIDSLTRHGIIIDDRSEFVERVEFKQKKVPKGEEQTIIQVFEIP